MMTAVLFLVALAADLPPLPKNYHVKLSNPVSSKTSKPGAAIRAAVISPESLLNGYLEGVLAPAAKGRVVLQFTRLVYKGSTTPLNLELVSFVNSKGHKSVDEDERPLVVEAGVMSGGPGVRHFWIDEGAELRLKVRDAAPVGRK